MTTKRRKSAAVRFLENLTGGPLTLGSAIRATREGDDLAQAEFARKLGVSRSHLCDIEKGRKPVSASRAAEFARTLGYSEQQWIQLALEDQLRRAKLNFRVQIEAA